MPELHIITGSNGAGKSTVGSTYLPAHIRDNYTFFDGDRLFGEKKKDILKDRRITPKEARNLANEWLVNHFNELVANAIKKNDHFAYEGHFTDETSWDLVKRFKHKGYVVHLTFFWIEGSGSIANACN